MFRNPRRLPLAQLTAAILLALAGCARAQAPAVTQPSAVTYDARQLFEYDRSVPLLAEVQQPGTQGTGYTYYKLTYYSANNQTVPAELILPPAKPGEKLPCVVLMHGLGQDKTGLAFLWPSFAKAGYAVFAIDAQFHGDRKPRAPLELFGTSVYSTRDMIVQTIIDLRRGMDYLQSRPDIDPKRIGYVGLSMGGILGTILAAVDDRVQAPVLALAGGDFRLMAEKSQLSVVKRAREQLHDFADANIKALDPVDPIHWVAQIAPRPILFINGDKDTTVPVESANELKSAAGPNKVVYMYPGGHVPPFAEVPRVITRIVSWLDEHLKK